MVWASIGAAASVALAFAGSRLFAHRSIFDMLFQPPRPEAVDSKSGKTAPEKKQ